MVTATRKPMSRTLNLGRRLVSQLADAGLSVEEVRDPLRLRLAQTFGGAFHHPSRPVIFIRTGLPPMERRRVVDLVLAKIVEHRDSHLRSSAELLELEMAARRNGQTLTISSRLELARLWSVLPGNDSYAPFAEALDEMEELPDLRPSEYFWLAGCRDPQLSETVRFHEAGPRSKVA